MIIRDIKEKVFLDIINLQKIIIGSISLFLGLFIYLFNRSPDTIYLIDKHFDTFSSIGFFPPFKNHLFYSLPSFFHVFSLSLITAGLLPSNRKALIFSCSSWLLINCIFEFLQSKKEFILSIIPKWFNEFQYLDSISIYFKFGTYDLIDILFIILGSFCASLTLFYLDSCKKGGK
jgi:hypothetical protein